MGCAIDAQSGGTTVRSVIAGVVLAGGAARRMGGVDKAALELAGVSMLDRVLLAARPLCSPLVVVGPARPTVVDGVEFVLEAEVGGGPVPAIAAGLAVVARRAGDHPVEVVVVLAADLPLLTTAAVTALLDALAGGQSAAAALGPSGRAVPLLAAYRRSALAARLAALGPEGGGGRRAGLLLADDVVVVDLGDHVTLNVNTPADLARASKAFPSG